MTIDSVYRAGIQKLTKAGIADASIDAWLLLSYVTGLDKTHFFLDKGREMEIVQQKKYEELVRKRMERIPLQHLTGEQEFMGLPFGVNEHVLVPRQDTEVLVEEALKRCRPGTGVLDMCTGSGCIAVSIAIYGKADVTGVDVSADALVVARENASRNQVNINFIQSNLFEQVTGKYDMIVSNPPYIPTSVIQTLEPEVREYEPMLALDGAQDGLFFYRNITRQAAAYLRPSGWLLYEIGHDQGADVSAMMEDGFTNIEIIKDLAGLDRVVAGQIKA